MSELAGKLRGYTMHAGYVCCLNEMILEVNSVYVEAK